MENSQRNEMIHHNLAETMREIARRSDGVVLERQGLLLYAAGPSTPALWNGAIRVDPGLGTTEILAMAGDFFGDLERGYTFQTFDQLDGDLDRALQASAQEPQAEAPQMILESPPAESDVPPDVTIKQVAGEQDHEDFLATAGAAFQTLGVAPEAWRTAYPGLRSVAAPHIAALVTYVDETPAATGMLYVAHSVAEIIHVGTHPDHRRRGLGELVTRALTREGFKRGARLASLQSTPMGKGVYRRVGYEESGRYRWYIFPQGS